DQRLEREDLEPAPPASLWRAQHWLFPVPAEPFVEDADLLTGLATADDPQALRPKDHGPHADLVLQAQVHEHGVGDPWKAQTTQVLQERSPRQEDRAGEVVGDLLPWVLGVRRTSARGGVLPPVEYQVAELMQRREVLAVDGVGGVDDDDPAPVFPERREARNGVGERVTHDLHPDGLEELDRVVDRRVIHSQAVPHALRDVLDLVGVEAFHGPGLGNERSLPQHALDSYVVTDLPVDDRTQRWSQCLRVVSP